MEAITTQAPLPPIAESPPSRAVGQSEQKSRPMADQRKGTAQEIPAVSAAETERLVALIQEHLDSMNINISFSTYGSESERVAVVVKEKESGEVIREIPPKELQHLHMKMEELLGMIFNDRA